MGALRDLANTVFRNFRVNGDPESGPYSPTKAEIRALFGAAEDSITAGAENLIGTSTTALAIGGGIKTFTTQALKAWTLGQRLRAASDDGTKVMEGELIAYIGTELTLDVDYSEGVGTHADWNIGIAGARGQGSTAYATRAALEAALIPAVVLFVSIAGYSAAGDGGGALYKGVASEPGHAGKIQSADGAWWEIAEERPNVRMFGAKGDGAADDSAAIQAAIDYGSGRPSPDTGTAIELGSGIFRASGLNLKSRVYLDGAGEGACIIYMPDGANENILTIPDDAALIGWTGIVFDGNRSNNTAGSCIVFEAVAGNEGDSAAPYTKTDVPPHSYKHCRASRFAAGNAADDGIYINSSNFAVFFESFTVSHNGRDGFACYSSDSIYSHFYAEKNGRCGVYASGSNNKFISGKAIWNGRTTNTHGGFRDQGSHNNYIAIEAQDNYCDGILILGTSSIFLGCTSNTNGYLAVGSEGQSSQIHADIRVGAGAANIIFIGKAYSYKTAVGTDGLWTTQWPYYFNDYQPTTVAIWQVDFSPAKYNAKPNISNDILVNSGLLEMRAFSSDGIATFFDISPKSLTGTGNKTVRFGRTSEVGTVLTWQFFLPGTATLQHEIRLDSGAVSLCANAGDLLYAGGGAGTFRVKRTGGVRIPSFSAAPTTPAPDNGDVYYDTTLNKLRARANGAWVDLH